MRIKLLAVLAFVGIAAGSAFPQGKKYVLHNFTGGSDGANPQSAVALDRAGNLYGTTELGGTGCSEQNGCGTIYELTPNGTSGWNESILHSFQDSTDGGYPDGGLVFDKVGNFYGTAFDGGTIGSGIVFEMSPNGNGGWNESVLYNFPGGKNGAGPLNTLAIDGNGNLYGVTADGGTGGCSGGCGIVYELSPNGTGGWTESSLYSFPPLEGCCSPSPSGLSLDSKGNLYGTTANGGDNGYGTAFELSPNGKGGWNETVIYTFPSSVGGFPAGGVIPDNAGNLYGTTDEGGGGTCSGGGEGCGTVFKLSRNGMIWNATVLYAFAGGDDGQGPDSPLVPDQKGNLYGTTEYGGRGGCDYRVKGCGTVFRLTRTNLGVWKERSISLENGKDGRRPFGVALDDSGNVYGTAGRGGTGCSLPGCGTVFEVTP